MGRVLHLITPEPSASRAWFLPAPRHDSLLHASALAAAATLRRAPAEHRALIMGGSHAGRSARALGVPPAPRLAPPLGHPPLAGLALSRRLRAGPPLDAVVAWSPALADLAARWVAHRTTVLGVHLDAGELREHASPSRSEVVSTLTLESASPPPATTPPLGERLVHRRRSARAALRLEPSSIAVGLVADAPDAAVALAYVLGILRAAGIAAHGILPAGAGALRRGLRHAREGGHVRIHLAPVPPPALYHALDLAILVAPPQTQPPLPAAILSRRCLAAGTPIIAPPSALITPLLSGALSPARARSHSPADLAQAAHRLVHTPGALAAASAAAAATPPLATPISTQVLAALDSVGVCA